MDYVIVIILLLIVGVIEFLLVRKGMLAGKKSSQYLQSPGASSASSPINTVPPDNVREDEQSLPSDNEVYKKENVIHFPNKFSRPYGMAAGDRETHQTRQADEASALDLIQEIRGGSTPVEQKSQSSPLRILPLKAANDDDVPEEDIAETAGTDVEVLEVLEEEEPLSPEELPEEVEEIQDDDMGRGEDEQQALSPEDLIREGLDLVRQGSVQEGILKIETAVQQVPDRADAHFNLGIAYTLNDNLPQAINAYQRAIEIDHHYGKAHYNLGTLYLKQGDIQEAIPRLEQAVKLLSDPMKALWNLYEAYRSNGLFTKALSNLQRLIDLEPEDASLYNHLGICYVKLGDYAKAIDAWNRSVTLGAASGLIHYNLGKTYELYGEFGNAKEHYKQFIALAAKKPEWKELVTEVQDRLTNLH